METLFFKNILIFIILISVGALFSLMAVRIVLFMINRGVSLGDSLKNTSLAVLASSAIVSIGLVFSKLYDPLVEITRILSGAENYLMDSILYVFLFLFLAFVSWFLIIGSAVSLFSLMTKGLNELDEIKKDNWRLSILLAAIILMLTIMASSPIMGALESIIPYPDIPNIN